MKNILLNKCIYIIKTNKNYNQTKLEEIRYGLEGLYLLLSKIIIIIFISLILKITKQTLLFLFIFNIIRLPSFGLHASKS